MTPSKRTGSARTRGSSADRVPISSSRVTPCACAIGSSSSRVARRLPASSRDSVLVEMPVLRASAASVVPRSRRSSLSRSPIPASTRSHPSSIPGPALSSRVHTARCPCPRAAGAVVGESGQVHPDPALPAPAATGPAWWLVTAALGCGAGGAAGLGWYYSSLLMDPVQRPIYPERVLAADADTITLATTRLTGQPGVWGLRWPQGLAVIGPIEAG